MGSIFLMIAGASCFALGWISAIIVLFCYGYKSHDLHSFKAMETMIALPVTIITAYLMGALSCKWRFSVGRGEASFLVAIAATFTFYPALLPGFMKLVIAFFGVGISFYLARRKASA